MPVSTSTTQLVPAQSLVVDLMGLQTPSSPSVAEIPTVTPQSTPVAAPDTGGTVLSANAISNSSSDPRTLGPMAPISAPANVTTDSTSATGGIRPMTLAPSTPTHGGPSSLSLMDSSGGSGGGGDPPPDKPPIISGGPGYSLGATVDGTGSIWQTIPVGSVMSFLVSPPDEAGYVIDTTQTKWGGGTDYKGYTSQPADEPPPNQMSVQTGVMIHSASCGRRRMKNLVFTLAAGLSFTIGAVGQSAQPRPSVEERRITLDRPATLVALSRNGDVLAAVIDGRRVDVHSTLDGKRLIRLPDPKAPVYAVAVSRSGRWVATGGPAETVEYNLPQKDSSIRVDPGGTPGKLGGGAATKQDAKEFGYLLPARMPIVNPKVFVSHRGGSLLVSDSKTGESYRGFRDLPDPIVAVGFRDDENGVVTLDDRLAYRLLSFHGPNQPAARNDKHVKLNQFPSPQTSFSSDGTRLASLDATAEDRGEINIKLFDSHNPGFRMVPAGEVADPWAIAISSDGGLFATGGRGGAISVWEFDGLRVLRTVKPSNPTNALFVCLSRDNNSVVSCDQEGRVSLWSVMDGRLLFTSRAPMQDIRAIEFGENHLTIISGGFRAGSGGVESLLIRRFDLTEALRGR